MKLIPEQIKYLRERKIELEERREEYKDYLRTRDRTGYDDVGVPQFGNYESDIEFSKYLEEIREIDRALATSEFVTKRNYEMIDIGTLFTVRFEDGDVEDMILVEKGISSNSTRMVSIESDLGKSVIGHKAGDNLTYTVGATGRKISITIDDIKKLKTDYERFLATRQTSSDRMSKRVRKDLKELRENNKEEYKIRHMITPSQAFLAKEELERIKPSSKNPSDINRRIFLLEVAKQENIIQPPEDDTVGIGSHVEILVQDETGETKEMSFELINRAVSTELSSHYLERITSLGNAIFGLKENDTFSVPRKNKPRLKGIIKSVDNNYYNTKGRAL